MKRDQQNIDKSNLAHSVPDLKKKRYLNEKKEDENLAADSVNVAAIGQRKYIKIIKDDAEKQQIQKNEETVKLSAVGKRRYIKPNPEMQKNAKIHETQLFDAKKHRERKRKEAKKETPPEVVEPIDNVCPYLLTHEEVQKLQEIGKKGDYKLLEMHAKGAESMLYKAQAGSKIFCVKAIRNRWDNWLGSSHTKNNQEKLQNVSYSTKTRHLRNEYSIAQALYNEKEEMPVVKVIYLKQVTRFGLELGYDLLMEYIEGEDLSDRNLIKKMSVDEKIRLFYQAVKALNYMHKRKIIHMDIKPSNFMLCKGGKLRLIDFGISVISGHKGHSIAGTTGYLSPEQVAKETLNEATDIFALGVTFSTFFGGKPLTQSHSELLQRSVRRDARYHLNSGDVSVIAEMPELIERGLFADIIRNCSIMKRDNRIQSCAILLQQLEHAAKSYDLNLE